MGYRTIEHKIAAGEDFTGEASDGEVTREKDMERYAETNKGGLFDFGNTGPIVVERIIIVFGGISQWNLDIVDADGTSIPWLDGNGGDNELVLWDAPLLLLESEKLKLTTSGGSTAQVARVSIRV